MVDREKVLAAISAQEQLRGSVPDEVVDVAVAALHAQLETAAPERRGQASVLFADVAGFTALSEPLDAELRRGLDERPVARRRRDHSPPRRTDRQAHRRRGDGRMGSDRALGRTIPSGRCGPLSTSGRVGQFTPTTASTIAVRIGVNTGPVAVRRGRTGGERSVTGDAVNVASRVGGAGPHGEVLVGPRHLPPRPWGVRRATARTGRASRARPSRYTPTWWNAPKARAFHLRTRGVEGVETPMIGRTGELAALEEPTSRRIADGTTRVVTVIGEPGAGKSRLLDEFADWLDLRPESVLYLKGRSSPTSRSFLSASSESCSLTGSRYSTTTHARRSQGSSATASRHSIPREAGAGRRVARVRPGTAARPWVSWLEVPSSP